MSILPFLDWTYVDGKWIHLVWAAIAVMGVLVFLEVRSRGAMATFLSPVMQRRLTAQPTLARTATRLGLIFLSLLCGIGALMRPQAPGETEVADVTQTSADVLFVLDVSRSMLAEDAPPTRLARAKAEIGELVAKLDETRVGLIAFAGRAVSVCPLTPDRSFFRTVLSTVDTRSAGRGGTKIGEAIKVAVKAFPPGPGAKLIVLITDGDDQDPYTQDAAKLARDAGIKIIAIGLGSETGSEITLVDPKTGAKTKLMHDGKPVISKLDGKALQNLALATEGVYVPAGTAAVDLKSILETHVLPIVREGGGASLRYVRVERFQWFVLAALAFLFGGLWVGASQGRER